MVMAITLIPCIISSFQCFLRPLAGLREGKRDGKQGSRNGRTEKVKEETK